MKTIIAGSRSEKRFGPVITAVGRSGFEITEVVCGAAEGVDTTGAELARGWYVPVKYFPAKWDTYGKAAGRQRNLEMAVYADALIAVWDGKSPGTRHMIQTAERMGLKVFVYRTDLGKV